MFYLVLNTPLDIKSMLAHAVFHDRNQAIKVIEIKVIEITKETENKKK